MMLANDGAKDKKNTKLDAIALAQLDRILILFSHPTSLPTCHPLTHFFDIRDRVTRAACNNARSRFYLAAFIQRQRAMAIRTSQRSLSSRLPVALHSPCVSDQRITAPRSTRETGNGGMPRSVTHPSRFTSIIAALRTSTSHRFSDARGELDARERTSLRRDQSSTH